MSDKKNVIIDIRGAFLKVERETGVKVTVVETAKKNNSSSASFRGWDKKAPKVVEIINNILEENPCLTWKDLVKKV